MAVVKAHTWHWQSNPTGRSTVRGAGGRWP